MKLHRTLLAEEILSQNWLDSAWKKVYPNTGEGEQPIFVVLGMVALAASGWVYFKKR
ncbi:LPXTG cell wall anchor domain-containing protein [Enterococcus raffinosus]|uniref:LPXTG cell wall anchor domain-containing protein n=1 Tax=Enterococcus raffinosus TaxID=71452 RepID=UPI001C98444D|nr:LPXTG cell wall anchor domain-containing protein [Enterococcus raffinosus]QZO09382.1 LPXTG cell wall anchor domain-containing protein [Enterococcus raffinosus]